MAQLILEQTPRRCGGTNQVASTVFLAGLSLLNMVGFAYVNDLKKPKDPTQQVLSFY